ncbi:CmcI family methyltransferase [Nocardioides sp. HM23]|uniref:CmcI family methyltransferase n=1 Tax=Nocardioides bizhenqiangii TaxID=3095076 RepID=UPI002ACA6C52|nr:CmcI family methyltransferase [Nocardioides sp. HM23]MDZ5622889.1 CmcI family methyltransferase [Nocardioides sp. HM23]
MRTYRSQSFQRGKPRLRADGTRSPIVDVDVPALRRIQRGAMHHYWRGVMCNKNPFDLAIYGRLIWELKPATIIEIGYKFGGSGLWFADQTQAMGLDTRLYCIDVEQREEVTDDPRITFVHGDGRDLGATLTKDILDGLPHPWLVVEDADHHYLTTLGVLEFFAPHMVEGDYMAVEDGVCDTFDNQDKYDGGPNRAMDEFGAAHPETYEVDEEYCDYFGNNVTWCTNGWLRRTAAEWSG